MMKKRVLLVIVKNFQSIISLHMLKLVLNKNMDASDNEQGIKKLWPNNAG